MHLILSPAYLHKSKPWCIFRPLLASIVYLSIKFSVHPKQLWLVFDLWPPRTLMYQLSSGQNKAAEIYNLFPDFGAFLVKGQS